MLEVCHFESDGLHMFESSNGSKYYIEPEYYTAIPKSEEIKVGQKWLSIEGVKVEVIDCDEDYIKFRFKLGGAFLLRACKIDRFLENFRLIEE